MRVVSRKTLGMCFKMLVQQESHSKISIKIKNGHTANISFGSSNEFNYEFLVKSISIFKKCSKFKVVCVRRNGKFFN